MCPNCTECTNVFSKGGGEQLAQHASVPFLGNIISTSTHKSSDLNEFKKIILLFLGCIPLEPKLTQSEEDGKSFLEQFDNSAARQSILEIVTSVIRATTVEEET